MKVTFKGDYALKAMLDLCFYVGEPQSVEEIAKRQDIPLKFLEQILLTLKKGGFVKSLRGRQGGYVLARKPEKITLGQVIRYIEGPIEPISCVYEQSPTKCDFAANCVFYEVFKEIGQLIADKVDSLTFAQLKDKQVKRSMQKNSFLNYSI